MKKKIIFLVLGAIMLVSGFGIFVYAYNLKNDVIKDVPEKVLELKNKISNLDSQSIGYLMEQKLFSVEMAQDYLESVKKLELYMKDSSISEAFENYNRYEKTGLLSYYLLCFPGIILFFIGTLCSSRKKEYIDMSP